MHCIATASRGCSSSFGRLWSVRSMGTTSCARSLPRSVSQLPYRPVGIDKAVVKIAVTGGPCAGKSTTISDLRSRLTKLGFKVYCVPEAATTLFSNGGRFSQWSFENQVAFEENKIRLQIGAEDAFHNIAQLEGGPGVVLCDRGTMDSKAYVKDEVWDALMKRTGWNATKLRDNRYDAVVHMCTAARGAESFYSLANNSSRTESADEACALDTRLMESWRGHPRLSVVDNSGTSFDEKIGRVMRVVSKYVGILPPSKDAIKFRVNSIHPFPRNLHAIQRFEERMYLNSSEMHEGTDSSISAWDGARPWTPGASTGLDEHTSLSYPTTKADTCFRFTEKRAQYNTQAVSFVERRITRRQFSELRHFSDPSMKTLRKRVVSFVWNNRQHELSFFQDEYDGLVTLKVDLAGSIMDGSQLSPPPFIDVEEDITGVSEFSAYHMAHHDAGTFVAMQPAPAGIAQQHAANAS